MTLMFILWNPSVNASTTAMTTVTAPGIAPGTATAPTPGKSVTLSTVVDPHGEAGQPTGVKKETAKKFIQSFYRKYLYDFHNPKRKAPELTFSKSLRILLARNQQVCAAFSKDEVCGFGSDSDIYLDTQDTDDDLNYGNSRMRITEPRPGLVIVKFTVFPSLQNYAMKTIRYKMVWENKAWQVNDIFYENRSARTMILEENASHKK